MKKKITIIPLIIFLFILSIFFYLLIIDRDISRLPSNLLDKKVPSFETKSILKNEFADFHRYNSLIQFFDLIHDSIINILF